MIWIVVVAIIIYIIYKFSVDVGKDKADINGKSLSNKFQTVIESLNQTVFNGQAKVTITSDRSFNLYKEGNNKIFNFFYGTGHLTITWKYKFLQQEVIYEKTFHNVRDINVSEQVRIAEIVIKEGSEKIYNHQTRIMGNL